MLTSVFLTSSVRNFVGDLFCSFRQHIEQRSRFETCCSTTALFFRAKDTLSLNTKDPDFFESALDDGPLGPGGDNGLVEFALDDGPLGPNGDNGLVEFALDDGPLGPGGDNDLVELEGNNGSIGRKDENSPIDLDGDGSSSGVNDDDGSACLGGVVGENGDDLRVEV